MALTEYVAVVLEADQVADLARLGDALVSPGAWKDKGKTQPVAILTAAGAPMTSGIVVGPDGRASFYADLDPVLPCLAVDFGAGAMWVFSPTAMNELAEVVASFASRVATIEDLFTNLAETLGSLELTAVRTESAVVLNAGPALPPANTLPDGGLFIVTQATLETN